MLTLLLIAEGHISRKGEKDVNRFWFTQRFFGHFGRRIEHGADAVQSTQTLLGLPVDESRFDLQFVTLRPGDPGPVHRAPSSISWSAAERAHSDPPPGRARHNEVSGTRPRPDKAALMRRQ